MAQSPHPADPPLNDVDRLATATLDEALNDPAFVENLVAEGIIDEFEIERDAIDELGLRVDGDGE